MLNQALATQKTYPKESAPKGLPEDVGLFMVDM